MRGFALAYFLIIGALIAMFTGAVLVLGKDGLTASRSGIDANRSLYAAEAGLARAIAELERDPDWTVGFDAEELPKRTANFTVRFAADSGTANDRVSVNNLLGNTPTDSYRGSDTVPPHSALIIVEGNSGVGQVTVEALVVAGLNVMVGDALTATGKIEMSGEVSVRGQTSLANISPVPADLHTNSTENSTLVHYIPTSGGGIEVTGQLTATSSEPEPTVFDVSGSGLPGSKLRSNVPQKALPRPNIQALVSDQSSNPGPPIPAIPGELPISGDNHYSGSVTINGDVELLDNAGLFVDGDLTINGSLRGRGTVVVTGNSTFFGDSDVGFRDHDYVSLLSGGHVLLQGFKGQQYMESLAQANPVITRSLPPNEPETTLPPENLQSPNYPWDVPAELAWTNLQVGLKNIQELLYSASEEVDENPLALQNRILEDDERVDAYLSVISYHSLGSQHFWDGGSSLSGIATRTHNNAGVLREYMAAQGGGPLSASSFLHQRFQLLEDLFRRAQSARDGRWELSPPPEDPGAFSAFGFFVHYDDWDPSLGGIFDAMQSEDTYSFDGREKEIKDLVQAIQQFDVDRLGSAHFKGIVYTNGAFVATDDVVVQGTVIVNGNPNLDSPLEIDLGGTLGVRTFYPGDAGLFGHSALVYVEEFFHDGVHNLAGGGSLGVQRWVSR